MNLSTVRSFCSSLSANIKKRIQLRKYDNYNVAEYFRRQGAKVGENCCIMPRTLGSEPYLVKIGNHVCINYGVHLHTHDGGTWVFRKEMPDLRVFGPIVIEDNCFIGDGAKILPNVTIGENSIVGAGSVVISDVPPNSIVMGVPARRFGSPEKYKEKCIECWNKQKPPAFSAGSSMNWERSENVNVILKELKEHLIELFKEKLK